MHDKASPSISQGPCEPMLMLMVPHGSCLWSLPPMASIIGAACVAECDATGNEPSSGQTGHVLLLIYRPSCIHHIILSNNGVISKNELNCHRWRLVIWVGYVAECGAMGTAKIKHHYLEQIKFVKWINYELAYIPTVAELKVVKPSPTLLLPVIIVDVNPRSVDGGFTIFNCAIVALTREAFIACGITFRNTATKPVSSRPPIRLRFLDILQCGFEVHFQKCRLVLQNFMICARRPMDQQKNVITAQGRTTNLIQEF
ncbi:hypothetical protein KPL70_025248 [Citrus sinensis]|nr:hypothetical protein KPL70_025248 [Citrus sinensis]